MKHLLFAGSIVAGIAFASCEKDPQTPVVSEPELITTLAVRLTDTTGFDSTFIYKVDAGFGSGGSVRADTIVLRASRLYTARLTVLNEAVSPAEDVSAQISSEAGDHLFLYNADPASGAGSMQFVNGNKDGAGAPFNQTAVLQTGDPGPGRLTITLLHQPTNKAGTTPAAAGGETDLEAPFPVRILP